MFFDRFLVHTMIFIVFWYICALLFFLFVTSQIFEFRRLFGFRVSFFHFCFSLLHTAIISPHCTNFLYNIAIPVFADIANFLVYWLCYASFDFFCFLRILALVFRIYGFAISFASGPVFVAIWSVFARSSSGFSWLVVGRFTPFTF